MFCLKSIRYNSAILPFIGDCLLQVKSTTWKYQSRCFIKTSVATHVVYRGLSVYYIARIEELPAKVITSFDFHTDLSRRAKLATSTTKFRETQTSGFSWRVGVARTRGGVMHARARWRHRAVLTIKSHVTPFRDNRHLHSHALGLALRKGILRDFM